MSCPPESLETARGLFHSFLPAPLLDYGRGRSPECGFVSIFVLNTSKKSCCAVASLGGTSEPMLCLYLCSDRQILIDCATASAVACASHRIPEQEERIRDEQWMTNGYLRSRFSLIHGLLCHSYQRMEIIERLRYRFQFHLEIREDLEHRLVLSRSSSRFRSHLEE